MFETERDPIEPEEKDYRHEQLENKIKKLER